MNRFVYAPRVEALVLSEDTKRVIDLTDDIVSGSINRRLNAMSDIQLTLQNKNGRYTTAPYMINAMDRIIVKMSRVGDPFLVFSGYVDDAPYYQLYPGTVTVTASDTLKLLANNYFDPALPSVQNWFAKHGWTYIPDTGQLTRTNAGLGNDDLYGNMADIIISMMTEIGNWPASAISIYDLPRDFLSAIANLLNDQAQSSKEINDQIVVLLDTLYGGNGIMTGSGSSYSTSPGTNANPQTNPSTGNIDINAVAQLALNSGWSGNNAIIAVAISGMESSFHSQSMGYNTGGTYDTGLWQINSSHFGLAGTSLAAPPDGVGTLNMPSDWQAVRSSINPSVVAYIEGLWDPSTNAAAAFSTFQSQGFAAWTTYRIVNPNPGGNSFTDWNSRPDLKSKWNSLMSQAQAAVANVAIGNTGIGSGSTTQSSTATNRAQKGQTVADAVVQIAQSQVGIVENPPGSNSGPQINQYLAAANLLPGNPWCVAFVQWVFKKAGRPLSETGFSGSSGTVLAKGEKLNWTVSVPQAGDIIVWGDAHAGIVSGVQGNQIYTIQGNYGNGVQAVGPLTLGSSDLQDGLGINPTFLHPSNMGTPTTDIIGVGTTTVNPDGSISQSGTSPTYDATQTNLTYQQARVLGAQASFYSQTFQSSSTVLATSLTGERALANCMPIMEWIDTAIQASGRVYCSSPSGALLAFFPDRFGFFKRTPYFQINDIEIIDLSINRNDTNLVTHVFTAGPIVPGQGIVPLSWLSSATASVEDTAFKYFVNVPENFDPLQFLAKYGARPYQNEMPNVNNPLLLWMHGWMKFMEFWAQRYTANGSFTFMPELFPGGLISFEGKIQMFIESITHTFDLSSGFTTEAQLSSIAVAETAPKTIANKFPDLLNPSVSFGAETLHSNNPDGNSPSLSPGVAHGLSNG